MLGFRRDPEVGGGPFAPVLAALVLAVGCGGGKTGSRADGGDGGVPSPDVPATADSGAIDGARPDQADAAPSNDVRAGDAGDAGNAPDALGQSDARAPDAADAADAGVSASPWTHPLGSPGSPWPPALSYARLVYDSARHVVLMLGGPGDPNGPIDAWELDAATSTWTNRRPVPAPPAASWPPARGAFGAAHDAARERTFMYGGYNYFYYNDLWEYDGAARAWTNHTPATLPAAWPRDRNAHGLAVDADRGKLVLFGGRSLNPQTGGELLHNDLWEWDAVARSWIDRTPQPLPAAWPGPRVLFQMVYDPDRKRVIVFGGAGYDAFGNLTSQLAEVWEWDGAAGTFTNRTPATLPASWPPARYSHAMAYDSARRRMIVFGGLGSTHFQDLWEWNGATNAWTDLTPTPVPAPWPAARLGAGMTFEPTLGRIVLFGGSDFTTFNELWLWRPPGS